MKYQKHTRKKQKKKIEEETIRDTGILFELERRLKVESPFHRNFITYEFNGDRDKAFITLTNFKIVFSSSKDIDENLHVQVLMCDNKEIMISLETLKRSFINNFLQTTKKP